MHVIFTVTNDLGYDARMHRICGTLAAHGYGVTLVGRTLPHSMPLKNRPFAQKRLRCFFQKGFPFYAEYNLRLFFFLLFARFDAACSIDLDTLPAGCLATLIRRKKRVFDAHEYFTEVPEVTDRPFVKAFWEMVARMCLPFYRHAYTVGPELAKIFEKKYGIKFGVVRNSPSPGPSPVGRGGREDTGDYSVGNTEKDTGEHFEQKKEITWENKDEATDTEHSTASSTERSTVFSRPPLPTGEGPGEGLFYMGALNEGRGIETALEALRLLEGARLVLAGEGDLSEKLRHLAVELGVNERVTFLGYTPPEALRALAAQSWLCLNLLENRGLSYYYSLANKFFLSVQAGVPVLTMNFPEYRALNAQHEVAVLLDELTPESVAGAIGKLLSDKALYEHLRRQCLIAGSIWTWENEEAELLRIWASVR